MVHEKSVAELRAMVKAIRKDKVKAPSKMKKHELLAELGSDGEQEVHVPVVKKAPAVKKGMVVAPEVAPAVKSIMNPVTGVIPKAVVPSALKKTKQVATPAEVAVARQETSKMPVMKMIAGSQEARDRMASIRAMRKSKLTSVE